MASRVNTCREDFAGLASPATVAGMSAPLDYLGELDPDSPRPASEQIAGFLRAAIRTGRLEPGERLPSQTELASHYQVARETVKAAQRILEAERLIVRRQGSGVSVRMKPQRAVSLRPQIEAAFEQPHVTIDFAGFSGETLKNAIIEILDKVRAGILTPESVRIRILVTDTRGETMALPRRVGADSADPALQNRSDRISRRSLDTILDEVYEIEAHGLIGSISTEVRVHDFTPWFKMYILNDQEMFFGFYSIQENVARIDGESVPIYDLLGKDTALFFHSANDDSDTSDGPKIVAEGQAWFESMWNTLAREYVQ